MRNTSRMRIRGDVAFRPARLRWIGLVLSDDMADGIGVLRLAPHGRGVSGLAGFQAGSARDGRALALPSLAARRACTARGIKRWPGLPPEDAIGKAGSGCFPDLPETGYYQTLRVTERSPQKSVSKAAGAASGNLSCRPGLVAVACREGASLAGLPVPSGASFGAPCVRQ
ncbi:hypothetical protein CBM2625_B20092 [Cupriavidus taiwanensis]|nr:hypothetical protein CBM2625_B20092 [Cupriavidus taiwanensis]